MLNEAISMPAVFISFSTFIKAENDEAYEKERRAMAITAQSLTVQTQ